MNATVHCPALHASFLHLYLPSNPAAIAALFHP
jgi:hypothetical protein